MSSQKDPKYTKPKLRERIKEEIKASDKGGNPGQWSARKAQLLVQEYEKQGGGYVDDEKDDDAKSLEQWSDEDWQTQDGNSRARQSDGSTRRYLPKEAWENMSEQEKQQTDRKKRKASRKGQQYVSNTKAAKQARKQVQDSHRSDLHEKRKDELMTLAQKMDLRGRSRMTKDELISALRRAS